MFSNLPFYLLALGFFENCFLVIAPDPISLHAPVLDHPVQAATTSEASHSGGILAPVKVSTGRMKPISSTGSPRYQEALDEAGVGSTKFMKSVSHVGVLPHSTSEHLYPKVSVIPGRKDSTVVSVFHHPNPDPQNGKPYEYLHHQRQDEQSDISHPAKFYRLGQRKIVQGSEDSEHRHKLLKMMGKNQHIPKAALVSTVQGDSRAKRKKPTINVDPGRYSGNMVTTVYGPDSPPKHGPSFSLQHTAHPVPSGGSAPRQGITRSRSTSPGGGNSGKRSRFEPQ